LRGLCSKQSRTVTAIFYFFAIVLFWIASPSARNDDLWFRQLTGENASLAVNYEESLHCNVIARALPEAIQKCHRDYLFLRDSAFLDCFTFVSQ
jgi:hypothetical protein